MALEREGTTGRGPALDEEVVAHLYADLGAEHLAPLWTQTSDLMARAPAFGGVAHVWCWRALHERAGALVPVDQGGERRAFAFANPGLGGQPFATPTLWAAIQHLGAGEVAPEHRHTRPRPAGAVVRQASEGFPRP